MAAIHYPQLLAMMTGLTDLARNSQDRVNFRVLLLFSSAQSLLAPGTQLCPQPMRLRSLRALFLAQFRIGGQSEEHLPHVLVPLASSRTTFAIVHP